MSPLHDRGDRGRGVEQLLGHRHRRRPHAHRLRLLPHLLVRHLDGRQAQVPEDVLWLAQS